MIEARLVEVTANPKQSYGINWAGVVGSSIGGKDVHVTAEQSAGAPTTSINPVTGASDDGSAGHRPSSGSTIHRTVDPRDSSAMLLAS